jgi:hypothetical protein
MGVAILPKSTAFDHLPNSRQVMIVVLGGEVQMIHEPHGLLQPRMQLGSGKEVGLKLS